MKKPWEAFDLSYPASYMTLSNWNARKSMEIELAKRQFEHPEEFVNGLLCACGGYLFDTNQQDQGTPPMLRVKCKSCGKKYWRFP